MAARLGERSFLLGILLYARILDTVVFDESVQVNFQKSIDKKVILCYNITSVRTAIVRPSPYRVKFIGRGLMSIRR